MNCFIRLTKYELLKIIKQPILIVLALLVAGYGIYIFQYIRSEPEIINLYHEFDNLLSEETYQILSPYDFDLLQERGAISTENMEEIEGLSKPYSTFALSNVKRGADYILEQEKKRIDTMLQAQALMNFTQDSSEELYLFRYNQLVYERLNTQQELQMMDTIGWNEFLRWMGTMFPVNIYVLTLILFCIIACGNVFSKDYEIGIIAVLHSSYRGRRTIYNAKFLAVSIFCFIAFIVYWFIMFATVAFNCDMSGITAPVQSLPLFSSCPYNINILQMFLIQFFVQFLLAVFLCAISNLIGIIAKRGLFALTGTICVLFLTTVLAIPHNKMEEYQAFMNQTGVIERESYSQFQYESIGKLFNPGSAMKINQYFDHYDYLNIANYPVSRFLIFIIILLCMLLFIYILAQYIYTHQTFGNTIRKPFRRINHALQKNRTV